jgi:type IV pilus assembly protein PilY1
MGMPLKTILSLLALVLLSGTAAAAPTNIAQLPLLNISGSGTVKPNLMLLYDNSGSMRSAFTPDYINDTTTCRSRALMSGGMTRCIVGHPPFNSAEFNKQYYNPKVQYTPPVHADGTSYPSLNAAATTDWTTVTTDGFGVNDANLLGTTNVATTNLATGFPDLKWCDANDRCDVNAASYTYPNDSKYDPRPITANPYYYTIKVAEYCTDASLTTCQTTAVGAPAPADYPIPAKVRWCDSSALTRCQAKYVGNFKYPRFSNPNSGVVASYGTITIDASASNSALEISSVSVTEPGGSSYAITNGVVRAAKGTNSTDERSTVATALAASIIAKTGLAKQFTACVRTPTPSSSGVPACSSLGIALGANNIVAVVPIDCPAGTTGKGIGPCAVLANAERAGWPLTVTAPAVELQAAQAATALIRVSGKTRSSTTQELAGISLGGTALLANPLALGRNNNATSIASTISTAIGTQGTISAYIGGTSTLSSLCAGEPDTTVCLINTASDAAAKTVTMGGLSNNDAGNNKVYVAFKTEKSTAASPLQTDAIPTSTTPLGAGSAVFVRVDIVPGATYPKEGSRTDCAGSTCTYAEEMTNFANWYGYYKTRNQMMKTAVGQAFRPITSNYNVGLASLSSAAAGGAMTRPQQFSGDHRSAWYTTLYAMDGNSTTPTRAALHSIGKMYANLSPYNAAAGAEVVRFPCQQNFTFVTTDGYWNGAAAADVESNDEVDNPARFCSRAKGCVDPSDQSADSLADVALYWYNGGSNTAVSSLRPELEDLTKPGLVPAAAGENTRLHMTTYTLGLGVDGIMNYEPNYDTAATVGGDFYKLITGVTTGCPWNNNGPYIWPDPKTGESSSAAYQSRVDDLWHAAINGHGKYFSASDPLQVVEGLRKALANIEVKIGAAAAAATSTPNISQQDNDIFSATFTTVRWYGELTAKKIDTVTGIVGTTPVWNSSDKVGKDVSPTRKIWMLNPGTPATLKPFSFGDMTDIEKGWFDKKCSALAQCANLSAADRAIVDSGANIVNWLRGQQDYADDAVMRAYAKTGHIPAGAAAPLPIVLGDIASSKPAFMREPRKGYTAASYSTFKVDQADRRGTVFAAANDGMLHAFDAATGDELWAYAPRITMKKLHLQASTTYGTNHQFTVDGSPELADVMINGAWKTVLVAGFNGGGRGYYALDVTDPRNPVAMWELCADDSICTGTQHVPDLGLTFGAPQFGTWKKTATGEASWVVFLSSGYNNIPGSDGVNHGDGKGKLFVVDLATGKVESTVDTGSGSVATPSGFARLTAITANPSADPLVTYVYGGDTLGQMWRFDFTTAGSVSVVKMGTSIIRVNDVDVVQPITTRPDVTLCRVETTATDGTVSTAAQMVVAYGTGRLLDVPDVANTDRQSIYVLKDSPIGISTSEWRATSLMPRQSLARVAGSGDAGNAYTISGPEVDLSTQRGWFVDLDQNAGERVNLDPAIVAGGLNVVTNLPTSSSACSVGGTSNVYQLNVCTGAAIGLNRSGTGTIAGGTLSNTSAAVGFIVIRLPSGALKIITTTADGNNITGDVQPAISDGARRSGWRRVRN